ncbi:ArsR/SmtB family transcription factor [Flexivirga sp. B27]
MSEEPAATKVFTALTDASRRSVLTFVARNGGGSASDIAKALPISRQAVMKHLAVLEDSGLVRRERAGRAIRYVVVPDALYAASSWLRDLAESWDDRLEALRAAAENDRAD